MTHRRDLAGLVRAARSAPARFAPVSIACLPAGSLAVVVLLGIGLLAGTIGCGGRESRPDSAPRTGVLGFAAPESGSSSLLLVTLDTYRGDAFGAAGDPDARTPFLDRLARTGVQFETGLAGSPLTLPSHASILTGLDAPTHGVRDNGTFRLRERVPTLATELAARGFTTGAFVGAFPLDSRFGLDRGFSIYDDDVGDPSGAGGLVMAQRAGPLVVAAARAWWGSSPAGRRFTWVHLFDPHTPHDAPQALQRASPDPYRADVAWTDRHLGAAVRAGTEGPTWVVILGDHGESLGQHGESTHGVFVYDATIRIPAVIWPAPTGERPGLRRGVFRTIDFPATAFALLDLDPGEAPGRGLPLPAASNRTAATRDAPGSGVSAKDAARDAAAYMESYYPHFHYGWAPLRAVQEGRWKFIDAPEPELYDMEADPAESTNLAELEPDRVERLRGVLHRRAAETDAAESVELGDDERAALESLGYVTSTTTREDGPDPKRMIGVQNLLESAQGLISAGRWEESLQPLRIALGKDPRNKDIYQTMGIVYGALGRHREAVDSLARCLELPPHANDRIPRFELASAYLRLQRPEPAIRELLKLTNSYPDDATSWYNLGVAWNLQGDRSRALAAWRRALEADPGHELARRSLGRADSDSER